METQPLSATRGTTSGTRTILLIASVLVFMVGVQLFVLTESTDRLFAWTINSPLTAAFLGAAYWASCVMEFTASRRRRWADARIAIPAVLVFTAVTLVITLVHIDLFHLNEPSLVTRFLTWSWLFVYAVVPLVMLVLLVRQVRAPGADPVRRWTLPAWFRALLGIHAAILIPMGIALLALPTVAAEWWPWALTPLTGRAIGAWLVGLGIAAAQVVGENDWLRIRPATMSYTAFAVLEFAALARYPDEVAWATPEAWVYLLFLASSLGIGAYGWWRAAQCARAISADGAGGR
ncbi:hypothetical protein ACVBEQ_15120 [Nakamurella sp. GG22]